MHKRPKVCPHKGSVTDISDLPWSCLFPTEQRAPEHCVPGRALGMAARRVLLYQWGVAGVCSNPRSVCTGLCGGCCAVVVVEWQCTVTHCAAAGREVIFEVCLQCVSALVQALIPTAISLLETGLLRLPESCLIKSRSKSVMIINHTWKWACRVLAGSCAAAPSLSRAELFQAPFQFPKRRHRASAADRGGIHLAASRRPLPATSSSSVALGCGEGKESQAAGGGIIEGKSTEWFGSVWKR